MKNCTPRKQNIQCYLCGGSSANRSQSRSEKATLRSERYDRNLWGGTCTVCDEEDYSCLWECDDFLAVEGRWASASLTNSPRAFVFSQLDFSRIEWRKFAGHQFCYMYGGDWSTILNLVSEPNASRIRLGNACHVFCFVFFRTCCSFSSRTGFSFGKENWIDISVDRCRQIVYRKFSLFLIALETCLGMHTT